MSKLGCWEFLRTSINILCYTSVMYFYSDENSRKITILLDIFVAVYTGETKDICWMSKPD